MPVSSVQAPFLAPSERASAARPDDSAAASQFAGFLALAVNGAKSEQSDTAKPSGTSELDQAETAADDVDTGSVGESGAKVESAAASSASASSEVVRSIAALNPTLQAKLQRVMTRVEQETGHRVTVAETFRSQARQNALFAQGRQTAGAVVTWTQNSKHTQGRAVDVVLDGGAAGPDAYRALQRIAAEEGLQTLGARDPGHLELRGPNGARVDGTPTIPAAPADATGPGQVSMTRLASVARVAEVRTERPAATATVATVAEVARPGGTLLGSLNSRAYGSGSRGQSERESSRGHGYDQLPTTMTARLPQEAPVAAPVAPVASDAVARAERLLDARDSAPARPLSHITMNVDAGNGTSDRVQVALRGSALDATIDTGDSRVAHLLSAKSDELSRALSRDGIELRELRVRAATQSGTVTSAANAQAANAGADSSTQSRFDRGEAWHRRQDQQDQQDRRSQQERGRHQQRQRRGGEQ